MLNDGLSQIVTWVEYEKEKPSLDGRYIVLANDIVSEWQDYIDWCDGIWCDENGEYPGIVTHWTPELQRPA